MPRAGLHRRLDRLARAGARREERPIVLEVDADRRGDEALVDRALAAAGVEPGPTDLVVELPRFAPAAGAPACDALRVGPLGPAAAAGGAR
jgi:hypothetical protein